MICRAAWYLALLFGSPHYVSGLAKQKRRSDFTKHPNGDHGGFVQDVPEDEWDQFDMGEDTSSRTVPPHHKCSVCLGVGFLLWRAFEKKEMDRPSGRRVLDAYDIIDAVDDACSDANAENYGVMRVNGRNWLHGPGLNHVIGMRGAKLSNQQTKRWVQSSCRLYSSDEAHWPKGGEEEMYNKYYLPIRTSVQGPRSFQGQLCVLRMKNVCTMEEYDLIRKMHDPDKEIEVEGRQYVEKAMEKAGVDPHKKKRSKKKRKKKRKRKRQSVGGAFGEL